MSSSKVGPAGPSLLLTSVIRPTMGRTREGRELNHSTTEEFHGQICLIETTSPQESIRCSVFLGLGKPTTYVICDFGGRVAQSRSSWVRLTQTATNTTLCTPALPFYKGIVFDQYHTVLRGRHLFNSRVHPLVVVDHEPWSPAAWFIGGVGHFPTEVPVDCI